MGLLDTFRQWVMPTALLPDISPTPDAPVVVIAPITVPETDETPVLRYKDQTWVQQGEPNAKGILTFARDVVVNGKIAQSSVSVCVADLERTGNVYTLQGRT